jgi:hypothetical protein
MTTEPILGWVRRPDGAVLAIAKPIKENKLRVYYARATSKLGEKLTNYGLI